MAYVGNSRPASGSEHHLSHFFEIVGILDGDEYLPHGIDVAYSTVITSELREKLASCKFPERSYTQSREKLEKKIYDIYKTSAKGCLELQDKVGNYATDRTQIYLQKETQIKEILSECPSAEEIKNILSKVELDISEFYNLYGNDKIEKAVLYAKDLKDRYSVLWINYDIFGGQYD